MQGQNGQGQSKVKTQICQWKGVMAKVQTLR